MADTYNYRAEIEHGEDGRFVIHFPGLRVGRNGRRDTRRGAPRSQGLLRELIATTMREGEDLLEPSRAGKGRPLVVPPVLIALKAVLYEAYCQAGSQRRLACELDVAESEVWRMLNPEHSTKAASIGRALRRLGKRVSVSVGEGSMIPSRRKSPNRRINEPRRGSRAFVR